MTDERPDPRQFDDLVSDLETFADEVGTAPLGEVMARLPDALEKHRLATTMLEQFKEEIERFRAATCPVEDAGDETSGDGQAP